MKYQYTNDLYVSMSIGLTELNNIIKDLDMLQKAMKENPDKFSRKWILTSLWELRQAHKEAMSNAVPAFESNNKEDADV
jgi:hypothetical protein